jgi:DNA helicase II / ATP-dependent DNA helicase PcrA
LTSNSIPPWLEGIEGDALPSLIIGDSKLMLVVAGPGSGKTTGLKRRVMRLVQTKKVSPDQIFVGTFTRAIVRELADSLTSSVNSFPLTSDNAGVQVSTLHALALHLIQKYPTARPGRTLRFLLGFEREAMLYDIGEKLPDIPKQTNRKKELNRVCAAWAEGKDLATAGFVGELDRWLRRHEGMLIDEVVQIARLGLESGDIPAGCFDEVIIDEYQDLTATEQHLVEKIWSGKGSLLVLGDDDQSIYSFRYNHPRGVTEFHERWKDKQLLDVTLPENRRCGRVVVELANAMMAAAHSKKPPMLSKRKEEGELALVYWSSVSQEIAGLARYINERSETKFLVLVPRRFIGYRLKNAVGNDAQTSFHEEVLEAPLVQERFALASLAANPNDRVALRTLLGFKEKGAEFAPKRNAEAYESISESTATGVALLEAIAKGEIAVSGQGRKNLRDRAQNAVAFLSKLASNADGDDVIRTIFDPTIVMTVADEDAQEKATQDLEQLRDAALAVHEEIGEYDLAKILDRLRYRIAMRIPLTETAEARVRIMTLHGAKGLEADVVIVAGVADQIIPGVRPREPTEAEKMREEQRRLLYVSFTRAKRELVISWPKTMRYKDARKNNVRIDQVWRQPDQTVSLGKTALLPDLPQLPQTGKSWLKAKLGS